jgi:GH15 family glucan-1,4-alpha-glucosidase
MVEIADYALVGDTRSAALVSPAGSLDWMCAPRFDSPPLFGRLIDEESGGSFSVTVDDLVSTQRRYLDGSAVLETDMTTPTGVARLTDGMIANVRGALLPQNVLVRRIDCVSGRVKVLVHFDPRRGLPGSDPMRIRRDGRGIVCEWGSLALSLASTPNVEVEPGRTASTDLNEGQSVTLVMGVADRCPIAWVSPEKATRLLEETDRWWRRWSFALDHDGPHRDAVVRSLITLRLLTYSPSGAPIAAPTTSLPESIGGARNWDYRYAWPRDASIGLAAFLAAGDTGLARSFMHWLLHASRLSRPRLRVLYGIHGESAPDETEVDVSGYLGSSPVRVGNGAKDQHQLDVYGWVVDAAWLLEEAGQRLHSETWRAICGFADLVAEKWPEPDAGIWEVRGDPAHYVHSKLMAWLALDRITRMARDHRIRSRRVRVWERERDAIGSWIRTHGVDRDRNTLLWKAGSDEVDASLLILPVVGFEPAGSPLIAGTINAIRSELESEGGLVFRYRRKADGLEGDEGAFLPCSFWLVQALAGDGRIADATQLFDRLLSYANDVGLFAEEIDPASKQQLGNFPQAFTHATLVQAALALRDAQTTERLVS